MNKIIISILATALLVGGGFALVGNRGVVDTDQRVGALAGPDVYSYLFVHGPFTQNGGRMATTSTAATYTLLNSEIANVQKIEWSPNINTTVTLPASTTISFIPESGDRREVWLYNASTSATASITLAAGAGIDLQKNEDTADLAVLGLDWTKLTFIRQADSDITVIMEEFIEAD